MLKAFKRARDRFFGDGDASVAIPVFDGALKPNNLLEAAPVFAELSGLEDLAIGADGELYAACSHDIVQIGAAGDGRVVTSFDSPIQALSPFDTGFAVATQEGAFFRKGVFDGKQLDSVEGRPLACVGALQATDDGKLLMAEGSLDCAYGDWSTDLLSRGHSGRVIEYDPAVDKARVLASNLAYCYGVCADRGRMLVSESWAHNIMAIKNGRREVVVSGLPGYPARISRAGEGGFWLCVFAARTQLLEFVLREDGFRKEMMQTVEPRYWIAPALKSGEDFREPLQLGSVRQMGILKPWAPPRSYGLIIRLDENFHPRYSLHSRVGGKHHGIVAAVEHAGSLIVLSKGSGRLLRLPLSDIDQQDGRHDPHS